MKIIGLHGLPRAGKDSVARILHHTLRYQRIAFADPLKRAAAILLDRPLEECNGENGFDREARMPEWGFSMRWFLQVLGTECLRNQVTDDFWIRRAAVEIQKKRLLVPNVRIVITDVRFENEAQFIRQLGGQIVEVRRPGLRASSHASDKPVRCDWVLNNDGTLDDLWNTVQDEPRFDRPDRPASYGGTD
jgi:hypothetical protein